MRQPIRFSSVPENRKLRLSKESLRALSESTLGKVLGGATEQCEGNPSGSADIMCPPELC
jgi:hypothetical protein